ncbi:voltage-dependent calcium channel gamma-5 subunit-like isoform X2 [Scylla paramamosain]|uniref:voltage-dependent calcium channel gamma-5 subunit-like isoform X2 n=1 Tax=Scylla paramamosain TaxID=85552 RepID=UPI0030829DD0
MLSADVSVQVLWVGTGAAAGVSGVSLLAALVGGSWLVSTERLYNPAFRNGSSKVEYLTRRTVSGLFTLCVTEVGRTELRCSRIDYFPSETYSPDPSDATAAIPYAVLRSCGFFLSAAGLLLAAEVLCVGGRCSPRRRYLTFLAGVTFIISGLTMLLGVVIYIATLKGEVGDRLRPRSAFQPPLFTYTYGWCFLLLVVAFVSTEMAGTAAVFLFIYRHKREWLQKRQQLPLSLPAPARPRPRPPHPPLSRCQCASTTTFPLGPPSTPRSLPGSGAPSLTCTRRTTGPASLQFPEAPASHAPSPGVLHWPPSAAYPRAAVPQREVLQLGATHCLGPLPLAPVAPCRRSG